MDFSQQERNPAKKFGGLAAVILLHVFIVYALVSGLARKAVEVIAQIPVETKIIEEVKVPPTPPDAPPPPPKMMAPPPPFIPPPEVMVNTPPPVNAISAVSNVKPDNPVMPAPSVPVVAAPAAVAAPPVVVAGITDLNSCKPEYPRASQIAEETGTTRVEFIIGPTGQLIDAKIKKSSGSRNLDRATIAGLSKCKFVAGTQDGKAVQSTFSAEYVWKLEN
ncbi:protein TonB [Actimicrobium sp. GrIS 1.19]|uniref:energy transducer TonB n=1 Tax=Actimicrobium sp. GrIS 1.19 TaxID=3071708 RepID=UPI002DFD1979|nr:protein TonB [Actimicrobium sp. GrIS 1.19]